MKSVISNLEKKVKELLSNEATGHDWYHVDQVRKMALRIAEIEGGDKELIEIAALAHDVGDSKLHASKEVGRSVTLKVLHHAGVRGSVLKKVLHIIDTMAFSSGTVPNSLEGRIVQDADRLYALGAIGIARAFAFGGAKQRPLFDPEDRAHSTIGHFYDKLLLIKDKMNTPTGRAFGKKRHAYLEKFLQQFYAEWSAQD